MASLRWIRILVIVVAAGLHGGILAVLAYTYILYGYYDDMHLLLIGPVIVLSSLMGWRIVFHRARVLSDDKLTALAWGAVSALLAPVFSWLTFKLFWVVFFTADYVPLVAVFAVGIIFAPRLALYLRSRKSATRVERARTSRLAIASLILAICVACLVLAQNYVRSIALARNALIEIVPEEYVVFVLAPPSLLALVLGVFAFGGIWRSAGAVRGKDFATIGIGLAALEILLVSGILATQDTGLGVKLIRVSDGAEIRALRTSVSQVTFSPDGSLLAAFERPTLTSLGRTFKLWRVSDGKLVGRLKRPTLFNREHHVSFSPDGKLLAAGGDAISVWQTEDRKLVRTFGLGAKGSYNTYIQPVGFLNNSDLVTITPAETSQHRLSNEITVWRVREGKPLRKFKLIWPPESPGGCPEIALSHDGKLLAGKRGGAGVFLLPRTPVGIWRTEDGALVRWIHYTTCQGGKIAFTPDGEFLAVGTTKVALWRLADGALVRTLESSRQRSAQIDAPIQCISFSSDGRILAVGGSRMDIWQMPEGKLMHSLDGALYVAASPDGKLFALAIRPD